VGSSDGGHHLGAPKEVIGLGVFLCDGNREGGGDGGGNQRAARHGCAKEV
jgi:hypothetical protein